MNNNMNDVFNFFFDDMFPKKTHETKTIGDDVILSIIEPGHTKEDFEIELKRDELHISMPDNKKKTFKIPATVYEDDISAEYVAGILKIKFKKKETKSRKITIS